MITTQWIKGYPEDGAAAVIKIKSPTPVGYAVAVYKDGEWHDPQEGEGWVYEYDGEYIPVEDLGQS